MLINFLTLDDLQQFKVEFFTELKQCLKNEMPAQKKWLKSNEAKKLLKVSSGTLQTLRINGTLQFTKIGGIIYYDADHIQKTFLENLHSSQA
ncbi:MAG: helix-turn-helix domain-containing protein [Ferruginibacter sp.]